MGSTSPDEPRPRRCIDVGELRTAPHDVRFPTTNQTRHCFTRYIEYHRSVGLSIESVIAAVV
ncbi:Cytochrome c oxidase subunit 6b-1 [Acorus calamus]|uniref:Cytochrome c oxidase subunit 6b-1 n=1 Tax=Acorus calamus TaxID=4465 RepID=A0AAV9ELU4_ACOCL|nr:Cytochrome c oxidase subunit 6b-1 [Acorus calamus]